MNLLVIGVPFAALILSNAFASAAIFNGVLQLTIFIVTAMIPGKLVVHVHKIKHIVQGGEGGKNCAGSFEPKRATDECYALRSRPTSILGDSRLHPSIRAVPSSSNPAVELPGAQGSPGALGSSQAPPFDCTCSCPSGAAAEMADDQDSKYTINPCHFEHILKPTQT